MSGRHESDAGYMSVSRGTAGGSGGVEMEDMGDPWTTGRHRSMGRSSMANSISRPASPPRQPEGSSDSGIDAEDMMKVSVFGAGAVGGLVGAYLARQIQQGIGKMQLTLFARGEHLQTMKMTGLWVNLPGGEQFVVQEGPFVSFIDGSMASEVGHQDYVFVTTRAPDLNVATGALSSLLGPDTTVVTLQSGVPYWFCFGWRGQLQNEQIEPVDPTGALWDEIGPDRAVGAVFDVSCALTAPGEITVTTFGDMSLGEPEIGSQTPRLEILSEMLTAAGIVALAEDDIRSIIWSRLIADVAFGAIGALTLQSLGEMSNDPSSIQLAQRVTEELVSVAEAAGLEVDIDPEQVLADAARDRSSGKSSMQQDIANGRRPELENLLLAPKQIADQIGVDTPTLDVLSMLLDARCACIARPAEESAGSPSAPGVGGSAASMVTRPASPERGGSSDDSRYKSRAVSPDRGGRSSGDAYGGTRPASPERSQRRAPPPSFGTRPASPERGGGGGGGFATRPASPGRRQTDAFKSRAASPDRSANPAAGVYGTRPASPGRASGSDDEVQCPERYILLVDFQLRLLCFQLCACWCLPMHAGR